jgi:hypothetical protein
MSHFVADPLRSRRRFALAALSVLTLSLAVLSTLLLSLAAPTTATEPQGHEARFRSYVTGYSYWDNTPAGSATIAYPRGRFDTLHSRAGGTGTYGNPITVAVGHSISGGVSSPRFEPGTRFYIPNLRRYFIVEDQCGDGRRPQTRGCWTGFPEGAQNWLDVWVGGANTDRAVSDRCMAAITKTVTTIVNPRPDYAVAAGDISGRTCTRQYGDTAVSD